ncbi:hypothetical protein Tco_1266530, partial [Tanacetum coccineum]
VPPTPIREGAHGRANVQEIRIDDDDILNVPSLDSRFNVKKAKKAARQGFLPPDFSPAARQLLQPPGWIGLADLVDLVYVLKTKP